MLEYPSAKFLCLGDWNLTPEENEFLPNVSPLNGWCLNVLDSQHNPMPTRWKGNRCIDYVLTNLERHNVDIQFALKKFGDHIPIFLSYAFGNSTPGNDSHGPLKRVNHYVKPANVEDNAWTQAVSLSWKLRHYQVTEYYNHDQHSVDEYWSSLSEAFEDTLQCARILCQPEDLQLPTHMTAGVRAKNSRVAISKKPVYKTSRSPAHTKARQLRNAIGRIVELQRIIDAEGWNN